MSIIKYSFRDKSWSRELHSLNQHRGSHGAVVINEKIYAIGGGGMDSNLASIEVLDRSDPHTGWKVLSPMQFSRHAHAVIVASLVLGSEVRHFIYAVGGTTSGTTGLNDSTWTAPVDASSNCVDFVERYDVLEDRWHLCAPMRNPRRLHGK